MRRPTTSSVRSSYRPLLEPEHQSEGSLVRRLSMRERSRRMLSDNLIFNPLRRPRDRLYQELAERHRAARARALAATEPKFGREEKPILCTIVETDGGSYQSSTGVKNVTSDDIAVYCSYKRNNVNILFEHANGTSPFELTRIIIKTPSAGYSSPVREGLVYISMSPIQFKDTERYDRMDADENRPDTVLDHFGLNCMDGRRRPVFTGQQLIIQESSAVPTNQKDTSSTTSAPSAGGLIPNIPQWGTEMSGKRNETEPVAKFEISKSTNFAEIIFNPPITGRFILMKLYNNVAGEHKDKDFPIPLERAPPLFRLLRDERPPVGDPLRFDMIDDELEEHESAFGDSQDIEADFENVDVQAILFYGYVGRRCFPSIKAL